MRSHPLAALAVALCLGACAHSALRTEAPPMENGVYVSDNVCQGEGGCDSMHWRVGEKGVELRARLDPAAPVIAKAAPGEYVDVLEGQVRFIPRRGVVTRLDPKAEVAQGEPALAVGDVVYPIDFQGEGYMTLWRRGDEIMWFETGDTESGIQIAWDPEAPAQPGAILGMWVRVRTAKGETGWVGEGGFECVSKLAGDANCDVQ